MAGVSLTWLGHAAFRIDTPGRKRVYVDPWLSNPKCPEGEREPERVDLIALTHGHDDHAHGAEELGPVDVQLWGAFVLGIALGLIPAAAIALATSF